MASSQVRTRKLLRLKLTRDPHFDLQSKIYVKIFFITSVNSEYFQLYFVKKSNYFLNKKHQIRNLETKEQFLKYSKSSLFCFIRTRPDPQLVLGNLTRSELAFPNPDPTQTCYQQAGSHPYSGRTVCFVDLIAFGKIYLGSLNLSFLPFFPFDQTPC